MFRLFVISLSILILLSCENSSSSINVEYAEGPYGNARGEIEVTYFGIRDIVLTPKTIYVNIKPTENTVVGAVYCVEVVAVLEPKYPEQVEIQKHRGSECVQFTTVEKYRKDSRYINYNPVSPTMHFTEEEKSLYSTKDVHTQFKLVISKSIGQTIDCSKTPEVEGCGS